MFSQVLLDPTAGERARQLHEAPLRPRPILDPTDPRCGLELLDGQERSRGGASPRHGATERDTHFVNLEA